MEKTNSQKSSKLKTIFIKCVAVFLVIGFIVISLFGYMPIMGNAVAYIMMAHYSVNHNTQLVTDMPTYNFISGRYSSESALSMLEVNLKSGDMRETYEDSYYEQLLNSLYEKEAPYRMSLQKQFEMAFSSKSALGVDFGGLSFALTVDKEVFSSHWLDKNRNVPTPYWHLQIRSADKFSDETVDEELIDIFTEAIASIDRSHFPEGEMYDFAIDYYYDLTVKERVIISKK